MAYFGPQDVGVHRDDVLNASRRIENSSDINEFYGGGPPQQIGEYNNQWQRPITQWGTENSEWVVKLKASPYVGEIDFGRKEWARARDAVDAVLDLLLKEMRAKVMKYSHVRIDSYIRQGSARDGLKVIAPDEFDVGFEFHIEGLDFEEYQIPKDGRAIPGFCYIKVRNASASSLQQRYPELFSKGVFIEYNGTMFLSSKQLYLSVFLSIIDQSSESVEEKVRNEQGRIVFRLTRKVNPPAVNITIHLDDGVIDGFMQQGRVRNRVDGIRKIDVDIIPALRLKTDNNSIYEGTRVDARIHGICKWKEEGARNALEVANQELVWLINSVAYERHIFDVARNSEKQRYILTALRIVKTYFTKTRRKQSPPQIVSILKSYHLKQITCYLILYTCHLHPSIQINSAYRAMVHFMKLLEVCLEKRRLPHFFYSNTKIGTMFANYMNQGGRELRYDMFRKIPSDALQQALLSYKNHLCPDLGIIWGGCGEDPDLNKTFEEMSQEVSKGEFF